MSKRPFASLSWQGLGTKGSRDILDSGTSGLHVCGRDVSIYCVGVSWRPSRKDSRNCGFNLENVSLREEQKEATKKDTLIILPTGFGQSFIFQLLPFGFYFWLGAAGSFMLVVSPLNVLMRDQTVKLNDLQVSCLMFRNT